MWGSSFMYWREYMWTNNEMEVIINNIELDNVFVCRLIFLLIYSISIQFIIFVWQCVSLIVHSYSIIILFIQVKNIIIQASICIVIYSLNFFLILFMLRLIVGVLVSGVCFINLLSFRMSCSFFMVWMAIPAPRNNSLLKKAWLIKWRSLIEYFEIPIARAI